MSVFTSDEAAPPQANDWPGYPLPPLEFPVLLDPALTDPSVHCELEEAA